MSSHGERPLRHRDPATHTLPRLSPCFDDPDRCRDNITLYVNPNTTTITITIRQISTPINKLTASPALLLAGCSSSSPLIPSIFIISFFYDSYTPTYDPTQVDPGVSAAIANLVGAAQLEVRVGYFGICVNPDGGSFLCSNNATLLAQQISVDQDPLNLIWVAETFKDSVVFPYLM